MRSAYENPVVIETRCHRPPRPARPAHHRTPRRNARTQASSPRPSPLNSRPSDTRPCEPPRWRRSWLRSVSRRIPGRRTDCAAFPRAWARLSVLGVPLLPNAIAVRWPELKRRESTTLPLAPLAAARVAGCQARGGRARPRCTRRSGLDPAKSAAALFSGACGHREHSKLLVAGSRAATRKGRIHECPPDVSGRVLALDYREGQQLYHVIIHPPRLSF